MFHETAFHGTVFQKIGFDLEGSAACSASVRAAFSVKHMLYLELGFFRLFLVLFFFNVNEVSIVEKCKLSSFKDYLRRSFYSSN